MKVKINDSHLPEIYKKNREILNNQQDNRRFLK